jgi:RNA polymerase sigma factor (sigma-70 family)
MRNGRVLVVDDDEAVVAGLAGLLEMEGIESDGVFDRLSAEAMLSGRFYAVVVADMRLETEGDGLNLLDDIRRISPRSRVLTLTGFNTPEIEKEVRRRGSAIVIQKPGESSAILDAIHYLLAEVEQLAAADEVLELEKLYLQTRSALRGKAQKRYGLSADQAEDVMQDAWLLFLVKRRYVVTPASWLRGTVSNLSLQALDCSWRTRNVASEEILEAMPDASAFGHDDTRLIVSQALARLDDRSRELCQRIAIEGNSYAEASTSMGLPIGSVGPLYMRAKAKLRQTLETMGVDQ